MGGVSVFAGGMMQVLLISMMMRGISAQPQPTAADECCVYRCLNDYFVASAKNCAGSGGCDQQSLETAQDCLFSSNCPILYSNSNSSCATQCLAAHPPLQRKCMDDSLQVEAKCIADARKILKDCSNPCLSSICTDSCAKDAFMRSESCDNQGLLENKFCLQRAIMTEGDCIRNCPIPTSSACETRCLAAYYTGMKVCMVDQGREERVICHKLNYGIAETCRAACSTSPSTCPVIKT